MICGCNWNAFDDGSVGRVCDDPGRGWALSSDLSFLFDERVPVATGPLSAGTGPGVIKIRPIVVLPYLVFKICSDL